MTITITDDDVATVRLEQSTYTVNESVSSFTIGVILGGDRSIAIDANVALTPDTAVVGDYLVGNGDVTFNPGETQKQITVFISNDNIVEPLEHFRATLTAGSKAIVVTPSQAQIFIQDDDVAQIRFQSTPHSVNEADRIVNLTVVLLTSQPLGRAATFSFSTQDGTAVSTNNVDYDRVAGSLAIFNAGDTDGATKQISVSIIDDSRTEATESFTVTLSAVNGGGLVPTTSSTATVNIVDNDNAIIRFSPDSYTVLESQGSVSLSVVRIGVIERPVSVFVTLQAGTATLTDFTNVSATVTFNVVDSSVKSVPISITNDIIIEETESFTASLTAVTGAVVPNDGDTATITIIDDDVLTIVMEAVPSMVDEDDGVVTVIVRAVGGLQRTISLNVFTFDLTASNGDYVSKTEVITLDSANTARNFVVTILNDNTVENTETFGVNITTDESQVRIQDETVVITILDEDKLTLSISQASYTAQENAGVTTVGVTITGTTAVIVSGSVLSTRDGSAVNPDDYLPATQNLVIVPGENSKSMIITIVNDQLTEGSENIILELTTTNNGQIDIGRSAAVVLIQDDDVATVQFLSNQYFVNETDNSVLVAVILTGSVAQSTLVRVDTAQDSALAALDYVQIVDSRLTFTSGGAVIQYINITIRDDSFIEGSENFTATLTLLSPLATLGPVSTTRITILDNDVAGIGFALREITVPENGGPVQIAVDSTANLNTPVTVSITVTGITASPSDYTVANDITLTFTATGPSRQFFSFTPINDTRIESDELVTATLSTTNPQAVILTSQIQITIEDDDKAVVRLDRSTISTDEGDGLVNIGVSLTGTLDISVTVNLAANGLTATENNDFIFNDQAVVFQPGNTQVTRQVVINNDNAVEALEFFNVVLTSTDGNVEIGDPDRTIVTINDNDDASLFFQSATYTGLEDNEEVTLTVVLATTVPLQRQIIARFTLASGTAVSPEDFPSTTTATVTFNAGVGNLATRDVVIAIEDDNIVEPAQTFQVTIVPESGANVINPGTATVTILDNDVVSIRFLQDVYRFPEDATNTNVNVVVLSSSPLQKSVTIG
ncbi:partial, partial [Paramuricea clavata]